MVKGGFYEILGVPFEASEEEVKSRYRDLSLQNHSDKGGGDEEFGKIASAYEVLGNPHQRLKYDLGLLKEGGKGSEYVESEKLGEVYKNSDLVDDELSSKISVLLMKELEDNDLRVEDLSKYSNLLNGSYRVVLLNRNSKEVGQVSDFCQRKVKSSNFQDAIINVRKYLEVIENTFSIKRAVISALENIMPYQELSETYPSLSKEELDDYEGQNEFDSYPEKVESRILKRTYENREESISRKLEEFRKEVELLKVKIEQKRKKKEELLQELDKRLEDGDKLLYDEIEDKQEKITSFINDFSNYLNLMKENDDYPTKIISQAIQKEKSNEIDSLITQLENWEEKSWEEEVDNAHNEEEEFNDLSPINDEEKKELVEYLNNLLFQWLASPRETKNLTSLKRLRNNFDLTYEVDLNTVSNKGEAEVIRAKAIKNICGAVRSTGGSDEELVTKVKQINNDFIKKIISEIEKELGCKISDLPQEEQDLLLNSEEEEISQEGFARILVNRKAKILRDNIRVVWQQKAIKELNDYWESNQFEGKIDDRIQENVLGTNWEAKLYTNLTESEINLEKDKLKKLVDDAKESETRKKQIITWQNVAIEKIKDYWKTNSDNGELDGKINQKTIEEVFGKVDWDEDIKNETSEKEINDQRDQLLNLIDNSKSDENRIRNEANISYDDLLSKINSEKNKDADYTQLIDNLNWDYLISPKTKESLKSAWDTRKAELIQEEQQARQQSERDRKEREGSKKDELEDNTREERRNYQEINSEETRLNKELKKLRDPSLLSHLKIWENPYDKWFGELEEFLEKNDYQFMKEICQNNSENDKKELFSEIISIIEEERKIVKSKKDFNKSSYFKSGEIRGCLQEIFKVVNKRLSNELTEWKKNLKNDFESLEKEIQKLSSVIDKSQEKIAEILDKLIIQILNPPKNKGKLFNEQKVFNSFTDLLGKIKETGKAIDIAKRFIRGYLEGKNLFEEDNKKWLSELKEGNFKNSEEVAQYVREVKLSLSKTDTRIDNKDRSKSFSAIAIAFSVISLLILGGLIVFRIKELKKNKNIKK